MKVAGAGQKLTFPGSPSSSCHRIAEVKNQMSFLKNTLEGAVAPSLFVASVASTRGAQAGVQ